MSALRIPEVDFASPNAHEQLREALTNVGFFYLVNHDISGDLRAKVYSEMAHFFHQPQEEKNKVLANKYMRGYTLMNEETLDPKVQTQGDTKEGYYICRHVDLDSDEMQYPLHGPNVFPDKGKYPQFQETMETYHAEMCKLSFKVAQLFAAAAGEPGAFDGPGLFDRPMAALRLLRYGPVKSDISSGIFGAGAHTDYGLLTLLSTDENPGLQIFYQNEWIDVPPRADAFIVNIGDMGERWTNGVFKSTLHRVINVNGKERYSVPFFYEPNFTCTVECFPSCVSENNPPKYPPTTSGEHLVNMYKATHDAFNAHNDTVEVNCCCRPRVFAPMSFIDRSKAKPLALHGVVTGYHVFHPDQIQTLVHSGLNISTQDLNGWTALHCAVRLGQLANVVTLLHGTEQPDKLLELSTVDGWRALHLGIVYGHQHIVEELLGANADVDARLDGEEGLTPLHLAAAHDRAEILDLLLECGANAHLLTRNLQRSALHIAVAAGHVNCVKVLLTKTDLVALCDGEGISPLQQAHFMNANKTVHDQTTRDTILKLLEANHSYHHQPPLVDPFLLPSTISMF